MATATKHSTAVGVFNTRNEAEQAISDLRAAGFKDNQIGLVARNSSGDLEKTDGAGGTMAEEGAVAGAVAGAGIGGLVGLGVLSGLIPVIGPAIAAGTLGTILLNAAGGAALAGIVGALVGLGIPEEDAKYYEGEVHGGRFLVTVDAAGRYDEAWTILRTRGAYNKSNPAVASTSTTTRAATAAPSYAAAGATTGHATHGGGQSVQLKEEQLRVSKTAETTGDVTIRKEVHTEHKQVTVPVEREEIVIERHAVAGGRAATGDLRSEEIRIPVKEERVHVSKEAVVTEEVSIGKRKVVENETVGADLRKEEVKVEQKGDVTVRTDSKTKKNS